MPPTAFRPRSAGGVAPTCDSGLQSGLDGQVLQVAAHRRCGHQPARAVIARGEVARMHVAVDPDLVPTRHVAAAARSEEHTSELQSLMRISYAVFCLKT